VPAGLLRSDRGTDDPGVVQQRGRHHRGTDVDQREELVRLLAHAPADDEQPRRQQHLHVPQVLLHPVGPLLPAQVLLLAGPVGGPQLGVRTVQLEMPELGVRDQRAVQEQRAADAGAERQHHDQAALVPSRPERHLGDPGRVRVVEHRDRSAEPVGEQLRGGRVEPRLVDVGGGAGHAVHHHAGERDTDPVVPGEGIRHLGDRLHDPGDVGRLWRRHPMPLGDQFAAHGVDRCALHAGAADVDAEDGHLVSRLSYGHCCALYHAEPKSNRRAIRQTAARWGFHSYFRLVTLRLLG
jgi:hypothetical protein